MNSVLMLVVAGLFVALAVAFIAIAALARQVGVLFERVAPAGALTLHQGPEVGAPAPSFDLPTLSEGRVSVGGRNPAGRSQLLLFVGPTCPVCRGLMPVFRSLARSEERWLDLVLASDGGEPEAHRSYARDSGVDGLPYILSRELGMSFGVPKLPYGVLIDEAGVLRARGLINSREHLESLIEAKQRGVASMQEFLTQQAGGRP